MKKKDVMYVIPTAEIAGNKCAILPLSSAEDAGKYEFTSLDTNLVVLVPGLMHSLICGGVEKGESSLEAAVREIKEETGLQIAADRLSNGLVTGKMLQIRDENPTLLQIVAGYELLLNEDEVVFLSEKGAAQIPLVNVLLSLAEIPIRPSASWALVKNNLL